MAESPVERIKRIMAEKKAALNVAAKAEEPVKAEVKPEVAVAGPVTPTVTVTQLTVIPPPAKTSIITGTDQIHMMLSELEVALDNKLPGFAHILKDIHQHLGKDPATVTILKEEEMALIVKGLEQHGNITIVDSKTKPGKKSSKTQPISADML